MVAGRHGARAVAGVSLVASLLGTLTGCVGAPQYPGATGSVVLGVAGADADPDTEHTNVVGITIVEGGLGQCTGSLILPNLVMTARHCVSDTSQEFIVCSRFRDSSSGMTYEPTTAGPPFPVRRGGSRYTFRVSTNAEPNPFSTTDSVGGAEVIVPEGTATGANICGNDIALIRLAENITGVPLAVPRLDVAPVGGEPFTAVGYGITGAGEEDSGRRRSRHTGVNVENVGPLMLGRDLLVVHENEFVANTGTCQGDSGGPALEIVDGKTYVWGVLSRGDANSCNSPVYTRVDRFAGFIRSVARDAAAQGGYELPDWINPPTNGSAGNGQACTGDAQCASPLSCRSIPNGTEGALHRLCVDEDVSACVTGFVPGSSNVGGACIPDPTVMPPMPTSMPTAADGGMQPPVTTPRGTCSVSARSVGALGDGRGALIALGALAMAAGAVRRRRGA